ncbi:carbohydrate-binding module family 50 protein [Staphylotrichum tortipilum]|uniref:Carbohydrate-binding module family 50 protein n=1 Tax=Staphylotrichum tortipilum TaxID=2831512 RepID=A0AAN6MDZ6_9PEZI|nr:carbohydrate-binding module family 50 protein [Staphylotrichum longicolle]
MVGNCNKFHYVQQGQTCAMVAALYSISTAHYIAWNPAAKSDCTGLWSLTYAYFGLIGSTPTPTATVGTNGVSTPLPTQSGGLVSNCNKFVKVNSGDTYDGICFFNYIPTVNFVVWNGGPTPTVGPNGIMTPLPTQAGMGSNCNKFVKVNQGHTCDIVSFNNGPISAENFVAWNRGVGGRACTNLQANTYACISVKA